MVRTTRSVPENGHVYSNFQTESLDVVSGIAYGAGTHYCVFLYHSTSNRADSHEAVVRGSLQGPIRKARRESASLSRFFAHVPR